MLKSTLLLSTVLTELPPHVLGLFLNKVSAGVSTGRGLQGTAVLLRQQQWEHGRKAVLLVDSSGKGTLPFVHRCHRFLLFSNPSDETAPRGTRSSEAI